jgi:hypothetical protein
MADKLSGLALLARTPDGVALPEEPAFRGQKLVKVRHVQLEGHKLVFLEVRAVALDVLGLALHIHWKECSLVHEFFGWST